MNNTVLLYDGNNFCWKAVAVYDGIKGEKLFQIDKERNDFLKVLATNFVASYNRFKSITNRIVIVADSRSWRYGIYPEYKGKRKKPENINWENYAILVDEFYNILKSNGIIISKADAAEGDDLIFAWSKYFKSIGESSIILSMDRDLTQLVSNDNGVFIVQYDNTYKKLFALQSFINELDSKDNKSLITNMFSINDEVNNAKGIDREIINNFNTLLKTVTITIVDLDQFIFKKILTGDKGDNIYSPYVKIKKKKKYGIGEKTSEKIMATYNAKKRFKIKDLFNNSQIKIISDLIRLSMKLDKTLESKVIKGINLNTDLMLLAENTIPKKILNNMTNSIKENLLVSLNKSNLKNMNTLLKGVVKTIQRKDSSISLF